MKTNTHNPIHITGDKKLTPQFFFLTIGVVIALLVSSISLINLVFASLDKLFPDILNGVYTYGYSSGNFESIRTALSALIIFFPTFVILSHFLYKEVSKGLSSNNAVLRKWALYIILFCSVLAGVIDLAVLVRYFVSGELTTRFILKVLVVIIVSGTSFFFYFKQLKEKHTKAHAYTFLSIATVFVIGAIVTGFLVMGSPATQRKLQFDQRRIDDLSNIQSQVLSFWQQKNRLPERLDELVDPLNNWQSLPRDPEFTRGASYEYKKVADLQFEICATFALPIPQGIQENGGSGTYPMYDKSIAPDIAMTDRSFGGFTNESWDHQAGRTCFARTIDPERYKPFEDNPKQL